MFRRSIRPASSLLRASSRVSVRGIGHQDLAAPYVLPNAKKLIAPPMVYIKGEEMTAYTMELILEKVLCTTS